MHTLIHSIVRLIGLIVLVFILARCDASQEKAEFVVRIGDAVLLGEEVEAALANMAPELDSLQARNQYIEWWTTNELLAQEARERALQNEPEVQRKIEASERSVLISELTNQIEDQILPPSDDEIKIYFEQNIDDLRLRERYLWIRYLATADSLNAIRARTLLETISQHPSPDSLWQTLIREISVDTARALVISGNYYPESRLFRNNGALSAALTNLRIGAIAPMARINNVYHVIQLVNQAPTGSTPKLSWYQDEIRRLLQIQAKRQMYSSYVARLRNEAEASGQLVRGSH
jgi:hypothetical protein